MNNHDIARAFSGHRFDDALAHLAPNVRWILVGQSTIEGDQAVAALCRDTVRDTSNVTTTWLRFISTGEGDVVAVDAVGLYEGPDGTTSVSSCDIYEFVSGQVTAITSYAVEIDPQRPTPPTPVANQNESES